MPNPNDGFQPKKVFLSNFQPTSEVQYTALPQDDEAHQEEVDISTKPNRALCTLFAGQMLTSAAIFYWTYFFKGDSTTDINQISDQFTLWTNTMLGMNAVGQLTLTFIDPDNVPEKLKTAAKYINTLAMQMQAALGIETVALGGAMFAGKKWLDAQAAPGGQGMNMLLIGIQHAPSFFLITPISAVIQNVKPSDFFRNPSALFMIMRALFAASYCVRDQFGTAGYGPLNFKNGNDINYKMMAMMVAAFVGFILLANVAAYLLWYGIEKVGTKLGEGLRACGAFCSKVNADTSAHSTENRSTLGTLPGDP